ncbi:hypothetical protein GCM10011343_08450 [Flavobacterium orientale]|uniref:Uncharacterized protein n=1 Tax=Flavobacterium orientale TaxID=1756020 RepID=A0A917D9Z7_9FLAO|nr:hypothetical protein GCM10011343_08450 [Flavobacterium orientale]
MTHHFICNHCKYENKVSINESDRGTYQMQHGDFKETTCFNCLRKEKTHINDVYGKVSRKTIVTGFIIGLVLTIILLFTLPNIIIISTAIISIPTILFVYENSIVKTFNNYRIRKK